MDLSQFGKFYLIAKKWDDFAKGITSDDVTQDEVLEIKQYISKQTGVSVNTMKVAGEMFGPNCYYYGRYFPSWYDIYIVPEGHDSVQYHAAIGRKDTVLDRCCEDSDTLPCPRELPAFDSAIWA